jgi:MoxR-like ATPase
VTLQDKIQIIRGALRAQFIERDDVIDGLLCALLAQEHVILLGPPGTAKSLLAEVLCRCLIDAKYFVILLSPTTVPDELMGPIDLIAFDKGKFARKYEAYLPSAHIAFLDEIWRGSSAILNSMLRAINERTWKFDGATVKMPLQMVVAATNGLPASRDLDALYDRFALRYQVGRVKGHKAFERILRMEGMPGTTEKLTLSELDEARAKVAEVSVGDHIIKRVVTIRTDLVDHGYDISERRWRQLVKLFKARAYLDGRTEVSPPDVEVIADSAWYDPKDRHGILTKVLKHSAPAVSKAVELLDLARQELTKIPAYDGNNDVPVTTAAGQAKRRIAELIDDMQRVSDEASDEEMPRMNQIAGDLSEMKQDAVRRTLEVVHA